MPPTGRRQHAAPEQQDSSGGGVPLFATSVATSKRMWLLTSRVSAIVTSVDSETVWGGGGGGEQRKKARTGEVLRGKEAMVWAGGAMSYGRELGLGKVGYCRWPH